MKHILVKLQKAVDAEVRAYAELRYQLAREGISEMPQLISLALLAAIFVTIVIGIAALPGEGIFA